MPICIALFDIKDDKFTRLRKPVIEIVDKVDILNSFVVLLFSRSVVSDSLRPHGL